MIYTLIFLIVFFPLTLNIKIILKKNKYTLVSLYFFHIKVLNIFLSFDLLNIKIFLKNKTLFLPYYKIIPLKSKIKPYLDVNLVKIENKFIISESDILSIFFISSLLKATEIIKLKKYYIINKNNIYLTEKTKNEYIGKFKILFNIFVIIISILKIILGKIITWTKKRITE